MRRVILLSGGLDSLVMLAEAAKAGDEVFALHVSYGEYAKAESTVAKQLARLYRRHPGGGGVEEFIAIHAPLHKLSPCALTACERVEWEYGPDGRGDDRWICRECGFETDAESRAEEHEKRHGVKTPDKADEMSTWIVPGRNTVLLSLALSWAEALGAGAILFGVHRDDGDFPDQSHEYVEAFNAVAREGTVGKPLVIAPFANLTKAEVIRHGALLKAPMELALSCYKPITTQHCGECASCLARKAAFAEAKVIDNTVYHAGF